MNSRDLVPVFLEHIRKHAPKYYPAFGSEQICVQLLDRRERPTATLFQFEVRKGTQVRSIFVKVPHRNLPNQPESRDSYEKPRLFPRTDPQEMHWLHYTALQTIYEYILSLNKSELGAIRVLDYMPEYHAIFTENSSDLVFRQLFWKQNRLSSLFNKGELTPAFRNAGTWLRAYHTMPKEYGVKVRNSHRDDYIEAITRLIEFLFATLGYRRFFQNTAKVITDRAQAILPECLPLGLGHGDYAMRNILIGPNARISVLDTFAKWRTPIYEDIGYFLTDVKTLFPQVASQGFAFQPTQLTAYESAFVKGYFCEAPIPYSAIRLYEILALLDKWSGIITRIYRQPRLKEPLRLFSVILISSFFKRQTQRLVTEISKPAIEAERFHEFSI